MLQFKEFDVSEMSMSNYTTLVSEGNSPFIAIPVYPSRVFRHGYFFINTAKGIKSGADLKGKRGGVPEYSMTAAVFMRGVMQHAPQFLGRNLAQVEKMALPLGQPAHDAFSLAASAVSMHLRFRSVGLSVALQSSSR